MMRWSVWIFWQFYSTLPARTPESLIGQWVLAAFTNIILFYMETDGPTRYLIEHCPFMRVYIGSYLLVYTAIVASGIAAVFSWFLDVALFPLWDIAWQWVAPIGVAGWSWFISLNWLGWWALIRAAGRAIDRFLDSGLIALKFIDPYDMSLPVYQPPEPKRQTADEWVRETFTSKLYKPFHDEDLPDEQAPKEPPADSPSHIAFQLFYITTAALWGLWKLYRLFND